eukprot:CAMPEP_0175164460 /NCGR_PEP_ID=MMETSP0087-20121206/26429_1 /TAXON_ID=136419 /ORGANISM="Unknown Unknown, Strain D1" /LENGTH=156 /DNA_ID=CAMNT_0016453501 /DNA_START=108 /DNA_END=578 /DNA_ORIENTATION=+
MALLGVVLLVYATVVLFPQAWKPYNYDDPTYLCLQFCNNDPRYGFCLPTFITDVSCGCAVGCNCALQKQKLAINFTCASFCDKDNDALVNTWDYIQSISSLTSYSRTWTTYKQSVYSSSLWQTHDGFAHALQYPGGVAACLIGCAEYNASDTCALF